MYFETLELKNFGPFSEYKLSFSPDGINLIWGPNGTGKTQLIGAIIFSLMGKSVVDITPSGNLPSEVNLSICEGTITEIIRSRYDGINPDIHLDQFKSTQTDTADFDLADFLRKMLNDRDNPQLVLSAYHKLYVSLSDKELNSISQIQLGDSEVKKFLVSLSRNLQRVEKNTPILSEQQRQVIILLKEYVKRQSVNRSFPLILDDFISTFDDEGIEIIGNLIKDLFQKDQVIIFTHINLEKYKISQDIKNQQMLMHIPSANISSLSYNYFPRQNNPKATTFEQAQYKYTRGEIIQVEENRYYEFKEVKGDNPVRSICSIVDEYAVAFMNMKRKGVGRIYWGVRDDRNIVGVNLNTKQRDEIRRLVSEKLHMIEPPVAPTGYEINFFPILDLDKVEQNLFIVEVKIPSSQSELLFSTGKGEVYIKTDAGKKKLSALEIQKEILERHNKL
jgi:hypothetical protein